MSDAVDLASIVALATSQVVKRLEGAPRAATVKETRRYGGRHEAAAVLGTFLPDRLVPLTDDDTLDDVLSRSVPTVLGDGERGWTLASPVRIAALRQLRASGQARSVVEQNPAAPDDRLGIALQAYISGTAEPVAKLKDLAVAVAHHQACQWLRDAGYTELPEPGALNRRVDWLTLLEPFEHLAGRSFRGRTEELKTLREYAGVQPPGTLRGKGVRFLQDVFNFHDKPPLLIYGPGGVGKSTLVARFILEHAKALEEDRFPFAYLDFYRADIDPSEPLTLLAETIRQLGIAYPDAYSSAMEIRRGWLDQLRRGKSPQRARTAAVHDFALLIDRLGAADRPVVLVLDTFEEVQQRSVEQVEEIWQLLEELQSQVARLRVCIVGRGQIADHETQELNLKELDTEAAIGFLESSGIKDPALARKLARQYGGSPLSLKLVADLVAREGASGALDVETRSFFGVRAKQEVIQRQLYVRILGHIHDPDVRKLAHPGLVLRRLTPDLILEVLAEPCGLAIRTHEGAGRLFDALRREVSLVTVASDGSLVHRPDLRRVMLELLEEDEPDKTRHVHALAIEYYAARSQGPLERAEEIYHRLKLGQDTAEIDARWVEGVGPFLVGAIPEFTGSRRAYLAGRLELSVDDETRSAAELEDWERLTEQRVQRLLLRADATGALELLRVRRDRSPLSPLPLLEATALVLLGEWREAADLLDGEIQRAIEDGRQERALTLSLTAAEVAAGSSLDDLCVAADARLAELERVVTRPQDRLAVLSRRLVLDRKGADERRGALRKAFDAVDDDVLIASPLLIRWAARSFDAEDIARFSRALRLSPLPQDDPSSLRSLALALTSFDVEYSRRLDQPPGALAAQARIPLLDSVTESWGTFMAEGSQAVVSDTIRTILDTEGLTPAVATELARVMGTGLSFELESVRETADSTLSAHGGRRAVPPAIRRDVARALADAFTTPDDLRRLIRARLSVSLDAIAPSAASYEDAVQQTVDYAVQQGFLPELVAAAREARPVDPGLLRISEEVGVSTIVPMDPSAIPSLGGIDVAEWVERLAHIEGQVCRVEVGSSALATGFLVGPDLVLTADFALPHTLDADDVGFRFDYKTAAGGAIVTPGTRFRAGEIVARSAYDERPGSVGYALVEVRGDPGGQPIGGEQADSRGALRRWIEVPPWSSPLGPGSGLVIVQHPLGEPLRLALGADAVVGMSEDGTRLFHRLDTSPGSAGSPCFTLDLEPVAFQIGSSGGTRVAVTLAAVQEDLRQKGLDGLLGAAFA